MTARGRSGSRLSRVHALLIGLFLAVCLAGWFWWQREQRALWLENASIEQLAAAAPNNLSEVALFEQLGQKARQAQQWGRAAKAYQHACELAPDRVENWVGWARCVYEFAGFQPADNILSAFLQDHPKNGRAYLERGALRRVAKRTEAALADAIKATELTPGSGEAWALRGDLSLDQGIAGEAEIAFTKAKTLLTSGWPWVGLYQTYIQQKRFPEALMTAQEMKQRFSSVVEADLYIGEATVEMAQTSADNEKAREFLKAMEQRAGKLRTADLFALYFLIGRTYYNQRDWQSAKTYLEKAEAITPDHPEMLFALGRTYRALKDPRAEPTLTRQRKVYEKISVVRQYTAQINANPTDPRPRLELARWYAREGVLGNASIQYEEMIARGLETETAQRELKALEETGKLP